MEVLIPLTVVAVVIAWSIERFKPELWNKIVAKLPWKMIFRHAKIQACRNSAKPHYYWLFAYLWLWPTNRIL